MKTKSHTQRAATTARQATHQPATPTSNGQVARSTSLQMNVGEVSKKSTQCCLRQFCQCPPIDRIFDYRSHEKRPEGFHIARRHQRAWQGFWTVSQAEGADLQQVACSSGSPPPPQPIKELPASRLHLSAPDHKVF